MGQALYRKYRSKNLSEIVGQEHITKTLENALKSGKISHAYLFTGPRGVGKTSIARILAHEVNGLPYDETATHLDIIEIDAASNRRIDEIRDLRDKVHIAPASAKYKVYIIDEVHMLTKEAFNALLKTLEEPPAHAIFILATTEAHKLPETIVSRTQRFTFKPVSSEQVVAHLKYLAKEEGITISDDALQLAAEHGEGSFRDSISLLDQVSNISKKVELADVQRVLGIAPAEAISQLMTSLESGSVKPLLDQLTAMRVQGYSASSIAKQLAMVLREQLIEGQNILPAATVTGLLHKLLQVPAARDPESYLELVLLDIVLESAPQPVARPKAVPVAAPKVIEAPAAVEPQPEPIQDVIEQPESVEFDGSAEKLWAQLLGSIKQHHNTLYSVLRMAVPQYDGETLTLICGFPFHQKRLSEAKNKQTIADIIQQITGNTVTVTCIVQKGAKAPEVVLETPVTPPVVVATTTSESSPLEAISNIFGSVEMLE